MLCTRESFAPAQFDKKAAVFTLSRDYKLRRVKQSVLSTHVTSILILRMNNNNVLSFCNFCCVVLLLCAENTSLRQKYILLNVQKNERNKIQYSISIYYTSPTVSLWRTRHSTALPSPRRIIKAGRRRKATVPASLSLCPSCPSHSFSVCPFMRVAIVMR